MVTTRQQRSPAGAFYRSPAGAFGPGAVTEEVCAAWRCDSDTFNLPNRTEQGNLDDGGGFGACDNINNWSTLHLVSDQDTNRLIISKLGDFDPFALLSFEFTDSISVNPPPTGDVLNIASFISGLSSCTTSDGGRRWYYGGAFVDTVQGPFPVRVFEYYMVLSTRTTDNGDGTFSADLTFYQNVERGFANTKYPAWYGPGANPTRQLKVTKCATDTVAAYRCNTNEIENIGTRLAQPPSCQFLIAQGPAMQHVQISQTGGNPPLPASGNNGLVLWEGVSSGATWLWQGPGRCNPGTANPRNNIGTQGGYEESARSAVEIVSLDLRDANVNFQVGEDVKATIIP